MLPPLHQSKIFSTSVFFCVPSSAIVYLSVVWVLNRGYLLNYNYLVSPIFPISYFLGNLTLGMVFGLIKSCIVSAIAYLLIPSLRWPFILGSVVVLTVLEGDFYYKIFNASFGFG
jgi:hypothetical protein